MILADFTTLLLISLPLSLLGQWWILRRRWLARVQAAQARHARYQARAQMMITLTKQRIHALQVQRSAVPRPATWVDRVQAGDGELIVVDEDGFDATSAFLAEPALT